MFLTLSEAGRRIGQSRTTVRTMIKAGSIAGYVDPHSGLLRVRDSDVTDYLAKIDDITINEAARILGRSYHTVKKYVNAGLIPAKQWPDGIRLKRKDVLAFYESLAPVVNSKVEQDARDALRVTTLGTQAEYEKHSRNKRNVLNVV